MKYTTAILLAAGSGVRLKSKISKPLIEIGALPLVIHSLKTFEACGAIKDIIVVANASNINKISALIKKYKISKVKNIVLGGKRRQDSVHCGLKELDSSAELVLIHDSGRPFIDKKSVSCTIDTAAKCGAAILGVPVKATIKKVTTSQRHNVTSKFVEKTIDRSGLWEIQTPQVFQKKLILEAYKRFSNVPVTDDASLVEKLGKQVKLVEGSSFNIKITTPQDLELAKAISKLRRK